MGEALALDAAWIFAGFLALLLLIAVLLAARRFLLERGGGTVDCGLRSPAGAGSWRLGVASYQLDELRWYGALGVLLKPEEAFPRRSLTVISRRTPGPGETATLGPGQIVLEARTDDSSVELAMAEQAVTGFLAWLESAPPGAHMDNFT